MCGCTRVAAARRSAPCSRFRRSPRPHHRDVVADVADHAEIVGDEHQGEVVLSTKSVRRLSTWARTETSSALTGSSATRTRGRSARRRSRCAAAVRRRTDAAFRSLGPVHLGQHLARRCLEPAVDSLPWASRGSATMSRPHAGVERTHWVLEHDLELRRRSMSWRSGAPAISVPATPTLPDVGWSSPARIRSSVDLPDPDSPTTPNRSPA